MNAPVVLPDLARAAAQIIGGPGFAETAAPPVLATAWDDIVAGMSRLITDPDAIARCKPFVNGTDEVGWKRDVGLHDREDNERKWFFHYETADNESWPAEIPRFEDFFDALWLCSVAAKDLAARLARECDLLLGREDLPLTHAMLEGRVMTRVLLYKPAPEIVNDATDHFDRSGITVHWNTTHRGLVVYDQHREGHRVAECDPSRVALFPGKKFPGFYQDANLIRGLHGVRDERREEVVFTERTPPRISLVSFVHPRLTDDMARWIKGHEHIFKSIEKLAA